MNSLIENSVILSRAKKRFETRDASLLRHPELVEGSVQPVAAVYDRRGQSEAPFFIPAAVFDRRDKGSKS